MSRRLAWALPVLAISAAAALPARADDGLRTLAAPAAEITWGDALAVESRPADAHAADADLAGLTVAMAVQPAAARRPAARPAIAPVATAAPKALARLPEPATWVMLILGFGGIGAAVRRQLRRSDERFNEYIRRIVASADEG